MWSKQSGYLSPWRWAWLLVLLLIVSLSARAQTNPLLEVGSLDYKMAYETLQAELSRTLPLIAERLNLSEQHLIEALDKLTSSEQALNEARTNVESSQNQLASYRQSLENLRREYNQALEISRQQAAEYKALQTQYANLLILLAASEASQKQLIEHSERISQALKLSETELEKSEQSRLLAEQSIPWIIVGGVVLGAVGFFVGRNTK